MTIVFRRDYIIQTSNLKCIQTTHLKVIIKWSSPAVSAINYEHSSHCSKLIFLELPKQYMYKTTMLSTRVDCFAFVGSFISTQLSHLFHHIRWRTISMWHFSSTANELQSLYSWPSSIQFPRNIITVPLASIELAYSKTKTKKKQQIEKITTTQCR